MISLDNDGVAFLNRASGHLPRGTYVILGAPRGGTSMLSGALHIAGIPMGECVTAGTYEDPDMIGAVSARDHDRLTRLIQGRSQKYQRWGWKQPRDFDYFFAEVIPHLPDVHLLVVFRDVLAVANRNKISAGQELLPNMQATLAVYSQITRGLATVSCPTMLVSYEKALLKPRVLIDSLLEFTGAEFQEMAKLESFIAPSPTEYLESSFLLDGIGRVDVISSNVVSGWASLRDNRSPVVELSINGVFVGETTADQSRRDVLEKGLHGTGNCGFQFQLTGDSAVRPGDMVLVKIKGSRSGLSGSRIYMAG